jgi:hypothetical protein
MRAARLHVLHPELPSCADCGQWMYDPKTWKPSTRGGKPIPRAKGTPTPCWTCPRSKAGPEPGKPYPEGEMTGQSWAAYWYWRRCLADTTGLLPRDPVTIRNAALLQMIQDSVDRERSNPLNLLAVLMGGSKK